MAIKGCLSVTKYFLFVFNLFFFYFAFLLLLFAAQITIGVLIYTQRNNINSGVGKIVENVIKDYGLFSNQTDLEESWDFTQEKMQCCGWYTPSDWLQNQKIKENTSFNLYPCSCRNISAFDPESISNSTDNSELKTGFCTNPSKGTWPVYQTGCMNTLQTFILNNIISIVGVCIGIALLELFFMTSMCLCRNLSQNYNKLTRFP
ncbi:hypothetical protein GDO86_012479 [Hymenochirus boettgeri]|uniref:Tetraspanin n=1 Tax=Hymenochirus boettgeri TaxID=247094 RepID=A0A8T2IMJ5_9PIPI|nr:hypothetical protein GDO86_012479 [Hymenochirus boettgeri]